MNLIAFLAEKRLRMPDLKLVNNHINRNIHLDCSFPYMRLHWSDPACPHKLIICDCILMFSMLVVGVHLEGRCSPQKSNIRHHILAFLIPLRQVIVGGAACPQKLIEFFEDELGVEVRQLWGMTETSPAGTVGAPKVLCHDCCGGCVFAVGVG